MIDSKVFGATPRPFPFRLGARALAFAVALGLAALIGLAPAQAPRAARGLAAPEQQRTLEDWRGNSAGIAR